MEDLMSIDIYELFGVPLNADERLIKKAYRKKALKCHPDKNQGNPDAAILFLELSKALEILLDDVKRAAYNKQYNARKAAKIRNQELDSRRKKLKEDLESKERLVESQNKRSFRSAEQKLAEEIERLRKEGSKQLKEEMESIRRIIITEQVQNEHDIEVDDGNLYRLKIRWMSDKNDIENGGYNEEILSKIFSKYGNIAVLIVSKKKKGSGLIEFDKSETALTAYQLEKGFPQNPLNLTWLSGEPLPSKPSSASLFNTIRTNSDSSDSKQSTHIFPSMKHSYTKEGESSKSFDSNESDLESFVFAKLRAAEERKRNT